MNVRVYSMKPHIDCDAMFIDPPSGTFDPYHPEIYQGDEVVVVETLTQDQAIARKAELMSNDVIYTSRGNTVFILQRTGRTSADVIQELHDKMVSDCDTRSYINSVFYGNQKEN